MHRNSGFLAFVCTFEKLNGDIPDLYSGRRYSPSSVCTKPNVQAFGHDRGTTVPVLGLKVGV